MRRYRTYREQHFTTATDHSDAATLHLDWCSLGSANLTLKRVVQHLEREDVMTRRLRVHLRNEQADSRVRQGCGTYVIEFCIACRVTNSLLSGGYRAGHRWRLIAAFSILSVGYGDSSVSSNVKHV